MMREIAETAERRGISQSSIINQALESYFATKLARSAWETVSDDDWYNPKTFYTHSSDKQGHSHAIKLLIPKNLAGQVARIVSTGIIPEYRSNQDLFRDAILHRCHQVGKWLDDEELLREVTLLILQSEETMIAQQKADAEELIAITRDNLEEAWRRGDTAWMKHHIKDRLEKSYSIPESYRDEYVEMLKKFETLAKQGRAKGKLKLVEEG